MSRVFGFDVQDGQLFLSRPLSVEPMSTLHERGWALLCDHTLTDEEWATAFNILGPHIGVRLANLPMETVSRILETYSMELDPSDTQSTYFQALGDDESRLTHIIRERFEVLIKLAKEEGTSDPVMENSGLSELRPYFAKIPKYTITAALESLSALRSARKRK